MGNSGGGTATAYIAALEERIVLAIPSCAMCTYKDSIGAMPHCACNYVPNIANIFDMSDLMAMAHPKHFIQVSGKDDDIFPLFAAERSTSFAAPSPRKRRHSSSLIGASSSSLSTAFRWCVMDATVLRSVPSRSNIQHLIISYLILSSLA